MEEICHIIFMKKDKMKQLFIILFCFFGCFALADDNNGSAEDLMSKLNQLSDLIDSTEQISNSQTFRCSGYYADSSLLEKAKHEFHEYYEWLNREENIEERNKEKALFAGLGHCLIHNDNPETGILAFEIAVLLGESDAAFVLFEYYRSDGFTLPYEQTTENEANLKKATDYQRQAFELVLNSPSEDICNILYSFVIIQFVKPFIDNNPEIVHKTNVNGETLLHCINRIGMSEAGQVYLVDIANTLIKKGADVNARDNSGQTPLYLAYYPEIINILIMNGADVNARDNTGHTPLFYHVGITNNVILLDRPL